MTELTNGNDFTQNIHATSVLVGTVCVLIRGAAGSGKSSLALELIDGGATLVSDDQTIIQVDAGRVLASPPVPLEGLLEVRGVGILKVPFESSAPIGLVVDLVKEDAFERLPDAKQSIVALSGVDLTRILIHERDATAAVIVRSVLRHERLQIP